MWKVLGVETALIKSGDMWEERLIELSSRKKGSERFISLLNKGEVGYWFDTIEEIHSFSVVFPEDVSVEDLQFMKDFILKAHKSAKVPVMEYGGMPQRTTIILTSEMDKDVHKDSLHNRKQDREENEEIVKPAPSPHASKTTKGKAKARASPTKGKVGMSRHVKKKEVSTISKGPKDTRKVHK